MAFKTTKPPKHPILRIVYGIIKTARPRQWVKNIALFAPLIFSGFFFYNPPDAPSYFIQVLAASFVFSILTSSIYIINDIIDIKADRNHPYKKFRPIAQGILPIGYAKIFAALGLVATFGLSCLFPLAFSLLLATYLVLQLAYATYFKHIPILDIVSIAVGFLIRIYAGSAVVNLHMNVWFLLTVLSAALFIAVAKRQSERTLLSSLPRHQAGLTRKTLTSYSQRLLDQYTAMFATATWLTYALFTFQSPVNAKQLPTTSYFSFNIPRSFQNQKLLMLSVPFVILAVMRYLQLVYEKNRGESPDKILLSDKPLLATVAGFGIVVFVVVYML